VAELYPWSRSYIDVYDHFGLLRRHSHHGQTRIGEVAALSRKQLCRGEIVPQAPSRSADASPAAVHRPCPSRALIARNSIERQY
jgi:hypothetical protein